MFLCHQMSKWGFLDHWSIIHTQQSGNVTQSESFRKKKKLVIKEYYSTVMCLLSSGVSPFSLLRGTIADVNLNAVGNLNKTFRRQVGISKKKVLKALRFSVYLVLISCCVFIANSLVLFMILGIFDFMCLSADVSHQSKMSILWLPPHRTDLALYQLG